MIDRDRPAGHLRESGEAVLGYPPIPAQWPYGPLTKVANNGSSLPAPGDIVSEAGTQSNPDGHAGVVTAVSVSGGKGTVTIMEQNASSTDWGAIAVSGGALGSGVTGWLHHPGGGECTSYNGTTWKTANSPTGIDWGYDT